jgi:hypothetical protein
MSEKKVAGRNVAIALGIICTILGVGLVGAIANYTSIIDGKDNTITSLNTQIAIKDSQLTSLQNQVDNLTDITKMLKHTIWVDHYTISQPANSYTSWRPDVLYAGYVEVHVESTTNETYARVIYWAYGFDYDQQSHVGADGTVAFPLMPFFSVEIRVGNTDPDGANETVTIRYHY